MPIYNAKKMKKADFQCMKESTFFIYLVELTRYLTNFLKQINAPILQIAISIAIGTVNYALYLEANPFKNLRAKLSPHSL